MFESFFPRPRIFFLSALLWATISIALWYIFGADIGRAIGFDIPVEAQEPIVGLGYFITAEFCWFYLYYVIICAGFAAFWFRYLPHRWQIWSIVGSQIILFSTYFSVQVSVAINNWRRPFFDAVQDALSGESTTTAGDLYSLIWIFAQIAFLWIVVYVITRFFVSHYVFRWRTAMNDFYVGQWERVRHIEGASQRVQEDTMRFAGIVEGLGVAIVDSIMTLFAFLPVLLALSTNIT
jgi:peptide/bleomycin uptake transporter